MSTTLPAQTITAVVDDLIEGGSLSAGARLSAIDALATGAALRGLEADALIDGDLLDTLVVNCIPSHFWMYA